MADHLPHCRLIKNLPTDAGQVAVWLVDGCHIRSTSDIDFTNFGQAPFYAIVPPDEMWVDDVNGEVPGELEFYLANMLAQRQALKAGQSQEKAREAGDDADLQLRRKVDHLPAAPLKGEELAGMVQLETLGEDEYGNTIWLVNGRLVRGLSWDVDWVEGGHDLVDDFIPPHTIWIDDQTCTDEVDFIKDHHEVPERHEMSQGVAYEEAHRHANQTELKARKQRAVSTCSDDSQKEIHMALNSALQILKMQAEAETDPALKASRTLVYTTELEAMIKSEGDGQKGKLHEALGHLRLAFEIMGQVNVALDGGVDAELDKIGDAYSTLQKTWEAMKSGQPGDLRKEEARDLLGKEQPTEKAASAEAPAKDTEFGQQLLDAASAEDDKLIGQIIFNMRRLGKPEYNDVATRLAALMRTSDKEGIAHIAYNLIRLGKAQGADFGKMSIDSAPLDDKAQGALSLVQDILGKLASLKDPDESVQSHAVNRILASIMLAEMDLDAVRDALYPVRTQLREAGKAQGGDVDKVISSPKQKEYSFATVDGQTVKVGKDEHGKYYASVSYEGNVELETHGDTLADVEKWLEEYGISGVAEGAGKAQGHEMEKIATIWWKLVGHDTDLDEPTTVVEDYTGKAKIGDMGEQIIFQLHGTMPEKGDQRWVISANVGEGKPILDYGTKEFKTKREAQRDASAFTKERYPDESFKAAGLRLGPNDMAFVDMFKAQP